MIRIIPRLRVGLPKDQDFLPQCIGMTAHGSPRAEKPMNQSPPSCLRRLSPARLLIPTTKNMSALNMSALKDMPDVSQRTQIEFRNQREQLRHKLPVGPGPVAEHGLDRITELPERQTVLGDLEHRVVSKTSFATFFSQNSSVATGLAIDVDFS